MGQDQGTESCSNQHAEAAAVVGGRPGQYAGGPEGALEEVEEGAKVALGPS